MGWKSVQTACDIKHIVHVVDGHLCIGSHYISDINTFAPDGKLLTRNGPERKLRLNPEIFCRVFN